MKFMRFFPLTLALMFASAALAEGETYTKLYEFEGQGAVIESVYLNPEGECLGLSVDVAAKLTAWDVCRQRNLWSAQLAGTWPSRTVAWTDGATEFAITSPGKVKIFETTTGRLVKELVDMPDAVYVASDFSSDARHLALKDFKNQQLVVFDVAQGAVVKRVDMPATSDGSIVRFSPDDKIQFTADDSALVVAGWRKLVVIDFATGAKLREFRSDKMMFALTMAGDSTYAAYATDETDGDVLGTAHVVDLNTMREIRTFPNLGNVYGGSMKFSEDGDRLYWMSMKGNMSVWDVVQGTTVLETDNPAFKDPAGGVIFWESRPLFRFCFDMAPSLDFFMTTHPEQTTIEIWKMPAAQ